MNLDAYYDSERDATRDEIIGAIPRDSGHEACCDCTLGDLGAHCEAHFEDVASGYPEMTCGGYAVAIPLDVTDAGHDGHAFAECWLTCNACDDEAGETDDDDTHDASCWVTDRCVTCGECRHLCAGTDVGGRVW